MPYKVFSNSIVIFLRAEKAHFLKTIEMNTIFLEQISNPSSPIVVTLSNLTLKVDN